MNYPENTHHHEIGDLVIHDKDAKQAIMLMQVVAYTRDGRCKTRYVHPANPNKKSYINHIRALHDPKRFEIEVPHAR